MEQVIAIYIDCSKEQFLKWINSIVGHLKEDVKIGDDTIFYSGSMGRLLVMSNDGSSFLEVNCFFTPQPWATHVECSRQAAREVKCKVRCEPGAYYPEVNPLSNTWLEIDGTKEPIEERLFEWND